MWVSSMFFTVYDLHGEQGLRIDAHTSCLWAKGRVSRRSELKGRVPGQQVYPKSIQLICLHHSWGTRYWGSCLLNWGEQAEIHLGRRASQLLCSGGASGWPRTLILFWRKVLLYNYKPLPSLEYILVNAHHMLHEKPREIGTEEPMSQGWDEQTPEFCCDVAARFVPLCWYLDRSVQMEWNQIFCSPAALVYVRCLVDTCTQRVLGWTEKLQSNSITVVYIPG